MAAIYGQLIKAQFENAAADLSNVLGLVYYNTVSNTVKWYDNTAWRTGVDTASTQTLTGKTLSTGTLLTCIIDDYVDINEESAPATPSAGKVRLYAKTDKKLWITDSNGVATQVGASGGSGEINLVESPNDAVGWTTTGANGPTGTTTTTAGDLPLGGTVDTAIKLTSSTTAGAEASHYFSYPLAPGNALFSRKLKVELWMRPGTNFLPNEWTVSVYAGSTRMALSTDASGVTYLPNATGKFVTTFDADTSTAYTLRFSRPVNAGTNAAVLNVVAVVVGPGVQPQGAAVSGWTTFTPTITASGGGSVAAGTGSSGGAYGLWRRVGESMEVQMSWRFGSSGASFGSSGVYRFALPAGFTPNTSLMAGATPATYTVLGEGLFQDDSASDAFGLSVYFDHSASFIQAFLEESLTGAILGTTAPVTLAAGDFMHLKYTVPIAEWAGAGTVNIVQNDVEYAYSAATLTTAGATDSTTSNYRYGPAGAQIQSIASTTANSVTSYQVGFQTPITATDTITLQMTSDSGVTWTDSPCSGVIAMLNANTAYYGIRVQPFSATEVLVDFGNKGRDNYAAAAIGDNGSTWASIAAGSRRWRVKKTKGGQAVGFGEVGQSASGLVKSAGQLKGTNTNDAAATGYVGEYSEATQTSATNFPNTSAAYGGGINIVLAAGDWDISMFVEVRLNGAVSPSAEFEYGISTSSGNDTTGMTRGVNYGSNPMPPSTYNFSCTVPTYRVSITTPTTYYLKLKASWVSGGPPQYLGRISARRVR